MGVNRPYYVKLLTHYGAISGMDRFALSDVRGIIVEPGRSRQKDKGESKPRKVYLQGDRHHFQTKSNRSQNGGTGKSQTALRTSNRESENTPAGHKNC